MIWIGLHFTHIACKILFEMSSTHIPTNNSRNQPPTPKQKTLTNAVCISHTHPRRWGTCTKRRGACTAHVLPSLSQPHPRGTWWSSFLYEKGSPRGNLARVLVVHLVEGGSSTTGEQTNCDLTCYVKKEANHVGPTLEARLYTLEYFFMCPVNSQNKEKLA